ncbi:hypothetical protein [Streptomyces sp. NBC_00356]|uniref:hypothetical protein n=1 Tax=Streptomyces sp. NBC_00356 TaxID=2975724 RepID=UPI002E257D27
MNHPHYLTLTDDGERSLDWTHPADCPDGDQCDIARRTHRMRPEALWELVDGRPPGRYRLACVGFHALTLVDDKGAALVDAHHDEDDPDEATCDALYRETPPGYLGPPRCLYFADHRDAHNPDFHTDARGFRWRRAA